MPKGSSLIRAENIRHHVLNAPSPIWNYDDAVRLAHMNGANKRLGAFAGYSLDRACIISQHGITGHMTLAVEAYERACRNKQSVANPSYFTSGVGSFAGTVLWVIC